MAQGTRSSRNAVIRGEHDAAIGIIRETASARLHTRYLLGQCLNNNDSSFAVELIVHHGVRQQMVTQATSQLLESVSNIRGRHRSSQCITDWPFENFWRNPIETRHSRLLWYFLQPEQAHGCGHFLLGQFLAFLQTNGILPSGQCFSAEHCTVDCEDLRIDVLISSNISGSKFALVVENKINGAAHQDRQLERYVRELIDSRGFKPSEIFVLYVPRGRWQTPELDDWAAIEEIGVHARIITFEDHVLQWLNAMLDAQCGSVIPDEMRDNIKHYRNLIRFLKNKNTKNEMNKEMLKQIEKAAEEDGKVVSHAEVTDLINCAQELKDCVESVLRGRLLIGIKRFLENQKLGVNFYDEEDPLNPIVLESEFDARFAAESISVGIDGQESVISCFGANKYRGWIGYLRRKRTVLPEEDEIVLAEASAHFKPLADVEAEWYTYEDRGELDYDNCAEDVSIAAIATRLKQMHEGVVARLNAAKKGRRK